ncbi:hypothetical protein F7725_004981 [Dissostichus mawsoni]|uniref:Uncharacterized protein n=1 Tax=Dissostichus mawsoni TaxID=36200 RepID=A0A7J5XLR0_DISMA|nr:hypothetical protein F7725_004981 [Dissostichus mawsoni]
MTSPSLHLITMGFYGTLKLIFYKVSISVFLVEGFLREMKVVRRLVQHRDDEAFLRVSMKRKLDHGPDGRPFSSGKKHCKGNGYLSPASLVQATTPTTFGDLRLANGLSAQRRRVTSGPPPSGLQDWLHIFQAWSGPERLLALDELIDRCETGQVKHMMQVIEPQFQRDFISLLPKETSSWKSAFLRQHRIESNWRSGDTREPMCLRTLSGHTGGVWCSQMSVATVISGSTDRTLRVWDAESGECVHTLYGHTSTVRCMHLHGDRCVCVLSGHVAAVRCVQFDGRRVVSGGYDYMVKIWDAETEACLHTLQGHTNRVYSLQFDGAYVVSGSLDTSIRVWDAETGPNKHQSAVTCLQFCRGLVLSSSDDGTVKLWDLKTGSWVRDVVTLQSRGAGGVVWRIRASDTRLVCAAGSRNGTEETKLLVLDFDLDDRMKEEE